MGNGRKGRGKEIREEQRKRNVREGRFAIKGEMRGEGRVNMSMLISAAKIKLSKFFVLL